jgi:hypothetical protein
MIAWKIPTHSSIKTAELWTSISVHSYKKSSFKGHIRFLFGLNGWMYRHSNDTLAYGPFPTIFDAMKSAEKKLNGKT